MVRDPYAAPPATLCDPDRVRDLNPDWSCDVPGCDCGSTPSLLDGLAAQLFVGEASPGAFGISPEDAWTEDLKLELRLRYDLLALDREAEELRRKARELRDPAWLRALRWLRDRL
jgi:hypothetical protein